MRMQSPPGAHAATNTIGSLPAPECDKLGHRVVGPLRAVFFPTRATADENIVTKQMRDVRRAAGLWAVGPGPLIIYSHSTLSRFPPDKPLARCANASHLAWSLRARFGLQPYCAPTGRGGRSAAWRLHGRGNSSEVALRPAQNRPEQGETPCDGACSSWFLLALRLWPIR